VTDDDSGATGAPPKLTLGQRLLTALPNLQRAPAPTPETPAPDAPATRKGASGPGTSRAPGASGAGRDKAAGSGRKGTSSAADDVVVVPDAVIDADTDAHDDEALGAPAPRGARLRDAFLKPQAGAARPAQRPDEALAAMSKEEIVLLIKKIDDRERLMALFSAVLGVAVGVLLTVVTFHVNPAVGTKNHQTSSLILLEGGARILLSGIVVAAAMSRRRSLVGFSLLFLGTSMGSPLFALPFWALGGYLIWRVFKYQKALNARGGAPGRPARGGRVPANPRGAARAGASAGRDRAQAARQRGRRPPEPTGPTPSKRYTPPKPTRPRPPAPPS